jgi:hypothetical protein
LVLELGLAADAPSLNGAPVGSMNCCTEGGALPLAPIMLDTLPSLPAIDDGPGKSVADGGSRPSASGNEVVDLLTFRLSCNT